MQDWSVHLQTLKDGNRVKAVAFSHDGGLVASASHDETVRLWDAATDTLRSTLMDHTDWVMDVAFSHDGGLVASASRDGTVRVWDTAVEAATDTPRPELYMPPIDPNLRSIAFSSCDIHLKTDRGVILLPHSLSATISSTANVSNPCLFARGPWIQLDGHDLIAIPPDYQDQILFVSGALIVFHNGGATNASLTLSRRVITSLLGSIVASPSS
ncbi:WD40-repeat-containing domain protein [Microdochium trichocladiopsis]|uniref:WD40-repeat-containing domain protein n=1 Tax=Microdochium trichocladiopsis TaxID=1682393 RepID=A0A9P9BKT6_9PEZI|nr:WD40-repeat-containing domain protein [Microdochium trichocladiopsis]KAH7021551.1 WD40-repeat-containing domain protein [Microdochium trichocladiopsis]